MIDLFGWHTPLKIEALDSAEVSKSLRRGCLAASFRPRKTNAIAAEDASVSAFHRLRRPSAWDFSYLHDTI